MKNKRGQNSTILTFNATAEEKKIFLKTVKKENYHNLSEWIRRTLLARVEAVEKGV